MFEQVLQRILAGLGAGDQLIRTMGPTLALLLAMAAGGAVAQFFKFPLSRLVNDDAAFSWFVRSVAVLATFLLALFLTDTVTWPLALVAAFLQLAFYHATLAMIRRWWPWLEAYKGVGAVEPPATALLANAQRQADKAMDDGQESGT